MKNPKLGASLLSVPNFLLKDRSIKLKEAGIDYFHIDIMDGNFVSNLSFPPSLYIDLYKLLPESDFDLHFMVTDVAFNNLINKFIQYPPKFLSIHWEAKIDWESISFKLRNMNIKFGIAINPKTEIDEIELVLPKLDFVLLMSVNPGYGGQIFIEESYKKISYLNNLRKKLNLSFLIQVDGGLNLQIAKKLFSYEVDLLVIGQDLITNEDYKSYINNYRLT